MSDDPISYQDVLELEHAYVRAKAALDQVEIRNGYPAYPKVVSELMKSLSEGKWGNKGYDPRKTKEQIENIDSADMNICTSILTSCSRGERFSDGHWKNVLQSDIFDKVIARAKELTDPGTL